MPEDEKEIQWLKIKIAIFALGVFTAWGWIVVWLLNSIANK